MGMIEPARLSLKEKQWKLREDTILDAASELVISKGYNAMTMDDIANLVGISKATLYQHFDSKHDLIVCVACRTADRTFERMSTIDESAPPAERLRQLVTSMVEERYSAGSAPIIESMGDLSEILAADHPYAQKEARNIRFVTETIKAAKEAGALVDGLAAPVLVRVIMSTLRSTDMFHAVESGELSTEEISSTLLKMLLKF